MEKDSSWSSKWKISRLEESFFLNKNKEEVGLVGEVYEEYKLFSKKNNLHKYIIFNFNFIGLGKKIENYYEIRNSDTILLARKIIYANGVRDITIPKKINFECDYKNIFRRCENYKIIKNKKILFIGGGDTTTTFSGLLNYENKDITILTRNLKILNSRFNANNLFYKYKNINNYNQKFKLIEYKKIYSIKNNICNYDNEQIFFDICYIFIGYENSERLIWKLRRNNIDIFSPYDHGIKYIERLIGGESFFPNDGKYIFVPNRLNKFIKLVTET